MRDTVAILGALGAAFAAALGVHRRRRSRRLALIGQQRADSQSEARRRLEKFLEAMPVGVFIVTPDGNPYYANREAERLLGRGILPGEPSQGLTEVFRAYVTGTDEPYPAAASPLRRALSGETSHVDDMEIRGADVSVPVEVWGTPVLAADHSLDFAMTAFADVSERRRAAEDVQFLSAITATMSEGVVLVRASDHRVVYANHSFETMFGYGHGELVGRLAEDFTPPGGPSPAEDPAGLQALGTQGTWQGEVENVRRDGTSFWCAVTVTVLDHPKFGPAWI